MRTPARNRIRGRSARCVVRIAKGKSSPSAHGCFTDSALESRYEPIAFPKPATHTGLRDLARDRRRGLSARRTLSGYPSAPISLRLNWEIFAVAYIFVAIPLTVLLGCPAYLLIARYGRPSLGLCAMTGAGIGALPMTALMLSASHSGPMVGIVGGQGSGLLSELARLAPMALQFGIAGAAGGAAFWFSAGRDFRHRPGRS